MSTQLATVITADNVTGLANHFIKSGWFKDVTDVSKAVVKLMAGQELGVGAMASMSGINIIQGKPVLSANLLASQIKASGKYNYKVITRTIDKCEIEFFEKFNTEKYESIGKADFTIEEAANAKLTGKDNWRNYASDMLFARAISRGARTYCPDVFNGSPVYVPGELPEEDTKPTIDFISDQDLKLILKTLLPKIAELKGETVVEMQKKLQESYEVTGLNNLTVAQGKHLIREIENRVMNLEAIKFEQIQREEVQTEAEQVFEKEIETQTK